MLFSTQNHDLIVYVWVDDVDHNHLRSKTMKFDKDIETIKDLPILRLNESTCDMNVFLKPVAMFNEPILLLKNRLIFCEMTKYHKKSVLNNKRSLIVDFARKAGKESPIFNIEQDFSILDHKNWLEKSYSYGSKFEYKKSSEGEQGKKFSQIFYGACLYAGIDITSCEPSEIETKWSYKIRPKNSYDTYDHLWVSRYILHCLAEQDGLTISLGDPPYMTKSKIKLNGLLIKFSTSKKLKTDSNCPVLQTLDSFLKTV